MKKQIVAAGFVFFSFMLPLKASAAEFSKFYVFGDSLSDAGNLFNVTNAQGQPFPPSPPYFNGRFSNGPVWTEYLGDKLGLQPTLVTNLSTTPPIQGINFAFGGASSGLDNAVLPNQGLPGVLSQVGLFTKLLQDSNQKADPNALYTVFGGANDFLFLDDEDSATPVSNISKALGILAQAGAKNILVFNLPNLGALPAATNNRDPETLQQSTNEFNEGLATTIAALNQNPNLNIITVDAYSIFNQVIASPATFGFVNVKDPCLSPPSSICSNPNQYLFWDDVHPTTAAHELLADRAFLSIKSQEIPEPSAALGMVTLGALGAAILKRQQKKLHIIPTNRVLDAQSSRVKVES
jgi:phospholipase/lecithinase/hemolysin